MLSLFEDLLEQRRERPVDDLLTLLAASDLYLDVDGAGRDDVLANCIFFVIAGHATTSTLLAAGAHLLMDRPRELAALVRRSDWLADRCRGVPEIRVAYDADGCHRHRGRPRGRLSDTRWCSARSRLRCRQP
ncbi:MAG: hypothetical protein WCG47_23635 [Dermatophilaceae bacterium]